MICRLPTDRRSLVIEHIAYVQQDFAHLDVSSIVVVGSVELLAVGWSFSEDQWQYHATKARTVEWRHFATEGYGVYLS
jgi:hypothetical protein